jgi:ABC-type Mn2+/Zn2+ transport system ATPase subunit
MIKYSDDMHADNVKKVGNFAYMRRMNMLASKLITIMCTYVSNKLALVTYLLQILYHDFTTIYHISKSYDDWERDYLRLMEFWKDTRTVEKMEQMRLMDDQEIISIDVKIGSFRLSGGHVKLHRGHKILVKGNNGGGKSTLFNALVGNIDRLKLKYGVAGNYTQSFAYMHQTVLEFMPRTGVTIRQYFREEPEDGRIVRCLRLVFDEINLARFKKRIGNLDTLLSGNLSGGERIKVHIATKCYDVLYGGKRALILDEPETYLDEASRRYMLMNVYREFIDNLLVHISHINMDELKSYGLKWNTVLNIEDGVIECK